MAKRGRFIAAAALTFAALASAMRLVWKRAIEPDLISRSRLLADTSSWSSEQFGSDTQYCWTSNQSLMFGSKPPQGSESQDPALFELNTTTGVKTPLKRLSEILATTTVDMGHLVRVSPDGRYAIVNSKVVTLDGKLVPNAIGEEAIEWAQDSSHVICYGEEVNPYWNRIIINLDGEAKHAFFDWAPDKFDDGTVFKYTSPHSVLLVAGWYHKTYNPQTTSVRIEEHTIDDGNLVRQYTVLLPRKTEIEDIVFNPTGDRILLRFPIEHHEPFFSDFFNRMLHRAPGYPFIRDSIWTCRIDGSELHEIGGFKDRPLLADVVGLIPATSLTWTPDGKQISFIYDDRLYTAPIN